jgi:hypothetical protein
MPQFVLPNPLNVESFQDAILEPWRAVVGGMTSKMGRLCAPELAIVGFFMGIEAMNPWWNDVDNVAVSSYFPLARLYTLKPRLRNGFLDGIYPAGLGQGHNHPWQ